jgi:23S rRNA pseudouridine2457 synthase
MIKHHNFVLNKPYGYLSQFVNNQTRRKNKKLLGELYEFPEGTMPIGRLDEDSEGLLLLTTDGKLSEKVRDHTVEKEYYVQVDGIFSDEALAQLQQGVEIGLYGKLYNTLPCKAFRLEQAPEFSPRPKKIRDERHGPTSWISVILVEGKNRQVRKMTAAVGFPTLRLIRVRIGKMQLNDLAPGEVREVEGFELD